MYLVCQSLLEYDQLKTNKKGDVQQIEIEQLWFVIADYTFRSSTTSHTISDAGDALLKLILKNNKHKGESFVQSILDAYISNSIKPTNNTVKTLIVVLLAFNINLLPKAEESVEKIIAYALGKHSLKNNVLRAMLVANKKPDAVYIARLVVLCSLFKSNIKKNLKNCWMDDALTYNTNLWNYADHEK